jgi:hypothetical protein
VKRCLSWTQATFALLVVATALCSVCCSLAAEPPDGIAIFESDSNHIWNRTYACLFVRQSADGKPYGADAIDPLLWPETRYLLTGDSHRHGMACLDEFLGSHAERAVQDPLRRAILQHDLWALFDWVAAGEDLLKERQELEGRLAEAIHRLAITSEQVRTLPDTYDAAVAAQRFASEYDLQKPEQGFLPIDLFRSDGPWVCLSAYSNEPTAIVHFTGRSRFLVFMRLPGGREATLAYVAKLRSQSPLLRSQYADFLNLRLSQFPVGTEVALVRQMIVINNLGKLVPTSLTESVQFRVYHSITLGTKYLNYINGPSSHDQDFFEFRMSRQQLFAAHDGGLLGIAPSQTEFATFSTHGMDAFETKDPIDGLGAILGRCPACHSDSGIHSVQSRLRWMNPTPDHTGGNRNDYAIAWETRATIRKKEQQRDFKLLQNMGRQAQD